MFLALREIKKEKVRSGLIVAMIALIGYLIFILTGLALGLAQQNTDAYNSWGFQNVSLSDSANVDMRQSFMTKQQVGHLSKQEAVVGQTSVIAKVTGHANTAAVLVGTKANQFVAKSIQLTSGHQSKNQYQVVADEAFKQAGYELGDQIKLNDVQHRYTIVGFTKNAKMNVAPVLYGQLSTWHGLKSSMRGIYASAVVSKNADYRNHQSGVKTYSEQTFINKLPGYTAQTMTFELMIGFLMLISLIVIAVFLYILTLQKLPNYAVLRVQGVPSRILVGATISQSLLLAVGGLLIATILTIATALAMPAAVPMAFDLPILGSVGFGLLLMSLLGGLIPVRSVLKVDPVSVIGG